MFLEQLARELHACELVASSLHQQIENLAFIVNRPPELELLAAKGGGPPSRQDAIARSAGRERGAAGIKIMSPKRAPRSLRGLRLRGGERDPAPLGRPSKTKSCDADTRSGRAYSGARALRKGFDCAFECLGRIRGPKLNTGPRGFHQLRCLGVVAGTSFQLCES
jgi:hypothetical protein